MSDSIIFLKTLNLPEVNQREQKQNFNSINSVTVFGLFDLKSPNSSLTVIFITNSETGQSYLGASY